MVKKPFFSNILQRKKVKNITCSSQFIKSRNTQNELLICYQYFQPIHLWNLSYHKVQLVSYGNKWLFLAKWGLWMLFFALMVQEKLNWIRTQATFKIWILTNFFISNTDPKNLKIYCLLVQLVWPILIDKVDMLSSA